MQPQESDIFGEGSEDIRRSVHDVTAAIISVRALAETLAEHVPTLVAMSRAKNSAKQSQIPPTTLDSLPSIPSAMIKLCEIAREALLAFDNRPGATGNVTEAACGITGTATDWASRPYEPIGCAGASVLVVEDDETLRSVLLQRLQARGVRATSASQGDEALRLLDKTDFDLVLMDLRLPGMSGWETTKRLREKESARGRYTFIVGLTASPMLQDHARAKAVGMDDVLVKPLDESALQWIVERVSGSLT